MKFKIKTLNKIDPKGLELFTENFQVSDSEIAPNAIVVRSAKVDTSEFSELLAVARAGAGVNNITVDQATENGICVFNTPGANANAVAELVFITLGYVARNIGPGIEFTRGLSGESDDAINEKVEANKSKFKGIELRGKKLGVIGLGKIGVLVANHGIRNQMSVTAYDPFPTPVNMHSLESSVDIHSNLEEVVRGKDFLTIHVPLNAKTKNLIGTEQLSLLPGHSVVVNLSRKGVVEEDSLQSRLSEGKINRYITDFPTQSLLANPRVIGLPHLGASTGESETNCALMAVQQVMDYLKYGVIANSVNFPNISAPLHKTILSRLVVINKDLPNMIAHISAVIGDEGLNIHSYLNESNGKVGYNIIDFDRICPDSVVHKIENIKNVVRVRLILF